MVCWLWEGIDMRMTPKTKLVHTLLLNIAMCLAMSTLALLLSPGGLKPMSLLINFLLSYVICFIIGMVIPIVPLGMKLARACKAKPGSLAFSMIITALVNLFYTVINGLALTIFNAVLLGGAPWAAVPGSFLATFLPLYLLGFVVATLWNPIAMRLAHRITGE